MKEFEKGEWPENKVFWFHVEDADITEEIPVLVKKENLDGTEKGMVENSSYIELPPSGAEDLLLSKDTLVINNGFHKMIYIYFPDQWEKMYKFLEKKGSEDKLKWRPIKRYFFGTAHETKVCGGKLYIWDGLLKVCGIERKAILSKFEEGGEYYYTIQSDSL